MAGNLVEPHTEFNLSFPSHWWRWLSLINTGSKLAGRSSSDTSYQVQLGSRFQPITDVPQWQQMSWFDGSKFLIISLNLVLIFSELFVWLSWGQEQPKQIGQVLLCAALHVIGLQMTCCRLMNVWWTCRKSSETDLCFCSITLALWWCISVTSWLKLGIKTDANIAQCVCKSGKNVHSKIKVRRADRMQALVWQRERELVRCRSSF